MYRASALLLPLYGCFLKGQIFTEKLRDSGRNNFYRNNGGPVITGSEDSCLPHPVCREDIVPVYVRLGSCDTDILVFRKDGHGSFHIPDKLHRGRLSDMEHRIVDNEGKGMRLDILCLFYLLLSCIFINKILSVVVGGNPLPLGGGRSLVNP